MAPSRPHLRLLVLLLLLLVYHLESSAAPATRNPVICTCLDYGFDERRPDFKNTPLHELVSDEQLIGFDVDMRQAILRDRMNQPYTLRVLSGYGEVHVRTRTGECDVGWSPFYLSASREQCRPTANSSTCRLVEPEYINPATGHLWSNVSDSPGWSWEPYRCCSDFSGSYMPWRISAMYRHERRNFFEAIFLAIFSPFNINFLCFLFLGIILSGHIVWYAERTLNPDEFPTRYLDGVDDGMWWAAVTVTTVGYGDKSPKTPMGRAFGLLWMFIGIVLCSILTGYMALRFDSLIQGAVVNRIDDLKGKVVCGYPVTFTLTWVKSSAIIPYEAPNIAECGKRILDGTVDAVLMDEPIMINWIKSNIDDIGGLALSQYLSEWPVGLVFPEHATGVGAISASGGATSSYAVQDLVNEGLLAFLDTSTYQSLQRNWFPQDVLSGAAGGGSDDQIEWGFVAPVLGFLGLYILLQVVSLVVQTKAKKKGDAEDGSDTDSNRSSYGGYSVDDDEAHKKEVAADGISTSTSSSSSSSSSAVLPENAGFVDGTGLQTLPMPEAEPDAKMSMEGGAESPLPPPKPKQFELPPVKVSPAHQYMRRVVSASRLAATAAATEAKNEGEDSAAAAGNGAGAELSRMHLDRLETIEAKIDRLLVARFGKALAKMGKDKEKGHHHGGHHGFGKAVAKMSKDKGHHHGHHGHH